MSTKTTIKRIALVAAVAAAFGGLSTVAANATVASTVAQVAGSGDNGSGGIAGPANTLQVVVTNAQTSAASHNLREYVTISGGTFVSSFNGAAHTTIATTGLTAVQDAQAVSDTYTVNTPTAGSIVVNAYDETAVSSGLYASTASSTLTITVRTTGISGVLNLANSSAYLANQTHAATGTYTSTDDTVNVAGATAGNVAGEVQVTLKDGTGTSGATLGATALTASITGSGLLYGSSTNFVNTTQPTGGARVASATTSSGVAYFVIITDGTAGTGTVTIYDGSIVVATKTVTFSGAAAKAVASNNVNVVAAGGISATAIELYVTDANGNPVSGVNTSISGTAANTSVIATVGAASADSSSTGGAGYYTATITAATGATSGQSTTITYVVKDSLSNVIATAAPVTVSIGGTTIASLVLSTDAASYTPGQKVTASLVAKDSSGNPVADGNYGVFFDNTSTSSAVTLSPVTASAQLTSAPFGIGVSSHEYYAFAKGVATSTFYAPYTDGTVSLSSTLGTTNSGLATALQGTTLGASFSVTTGASTASQAATDAANEATDAANAATDAANAAADAADAATSAAQDASAKADAALAAVNALSAKITVLAAQIAKIVKKLGA